MGQHTRQLKNKCAQPATHTHTHMHMLHRTPSCRTQHTLHIEQHDANALSTRAVCNVFESADAETAAKRPANEKAAKKGQQKERPPTLGYATESPQMFNQKLYFTFHFGKVTDTKEPMGIPGP